MGYCKYWKELFREKVSLRNIKQLYYLKMIPSPGLVYLTPWVFDNNPVTPISTIKKGSKHWWFILEDKCGSLIEHKGKVRHVRTSYNSQSKCPSLFVLFSFCYPLLENLFEFSLIHYRYYVMKYFVAFNKTRLAHLDRRRGILSKNGLFKSGLVEEHLLSNE